MTKRIVVLNVDGSERVLDAVPKLAEMQAIVEGFIEHVTVLDRIEPDGAFVYTSMFVNENGLLDNLPRNAKATEIYQRNLRAAYPDAANPFQAAQAEFVEAVEAIGATLIDARPEVPGYEDDPYICGPALLFEGYTTDEVNAATRDEDDDE